MFLKNKLFCMLLSLVLVLSLSLGVCGAAFNDTEGHWAEKVIDKWAGKGVITGYECNFSPDSPIIRGEFAVIMDRLMKYTEMSVNEFADLDKGAYYAEAILKLNKVSIMLGFNGMISPEEYVTREEAFVMLNRAYNLGSGKYEISFADKDEISDWAYEAVCAMCEKKIINGNENNMVCPKDTVTRAEVIQLIENISNLKDGNDMPFIPNVGGLVIGDPYNKPGTEADTTPDGDNTGIGGAGAATGENIVDVGTIQW